MHIVILSRNAGLYSTKRLVEEGINLGHKTEVVDHLRCNIVIEKKNPRIYYKDRYLDEVDAIIPRIGASVTFFGSAVVRQFEMRKVFTAVESQALIRSRDKLRSLQILARAGIGLPKTVFTNYSRNIDEILHEIGSLPVIIKLLEGTQGLGVVLAENKNAATSVIEAFHGLKARIIVQEFIREAKGADVRALVVDGKVVGAMKRQAKEGEFRSNLHRGGTGTPIKLSREEKEVAIAAAKAMGLGVAGVDMLQSNRGPLVMEVNSSPGLEGIEKASGINIARKIIGYLEKNAYRGKSQKDKINA
ncbi:MAG: 30S ribosomal protein S6--L-glutamate ligase [Candidatus Competibacteraceae bacterium]|nr:30S ribosomal protein S6--L-glutamate ligase [Candidatus Competibacteraceae bacterium]